MSLDMITPPSSPRRESGFVMGSPVKRVISFSLDVPRSPPKMRRVEDKKPEWMEKLKNRVSPNSPTIPLTPLNKIKKIFAPTAMMFSSVIHVNGKDT